jgi:hypothetical protein
MNAGVSQNPSIYLSFKKLYREGKKSPHQRPFHSFCFSFPLYVPQNDR